MQSLLAPVAVPAVAFFKAQVTEASYLQDIFYALATFCLLFVVAAVGLIDAGLVRRAHVFRPRALRASALQESGWYRATSRTDPCSRARRWRPARRRTAS